MVREAWELKEQGNTHFRNGEYAEAEELYTQAIARAGPEKARIFTNRANTRMKLQLYDGSMNDSLAAIKLHGAHSKESIKAYYYLAQAQLSLHHPNEALSSALTGYKISYEYNDSNVGPFTELVLQAKKQKWAVAEQQRIWAANEVLKRLEVMVITEKEKSLEEIDQKFKDGTLGFVGREEEQKNVENEYKETVTIMRENFAKENPELKQRDVPEYLIDNITFTIMQDPVVTRTGRSYERSSLIQHLNRSSTDPITREPISRHELLPNLNLREASEDFLLHNPWAVDW